VRAPTLLTLLLLTGGPSARAAPHRVAGAYHRLRADLAIWGSPKAAPWAGHWSDPVEGTGAHGSVRLAGAESARKATLRELERLGVRLARRADGRVHRVGPVVGAWIPFDALERLEEVEGLVHAQPAWRPRPVRPLWVTGAEVGARVAWDTAISREAALWSDLAANGHTGAGVVVGDLDAGFDIYHPSFFRPDGGHYDWLDVDEDGRFTPGVDAIDLDANGAAARDERAELLKGELHDRASWEVENTEDDLVVGLDWLYLDLDGDGKRDFGPARGFDESDSAYGEPLFLPDDVDGNGRLDPGERLLRLGTSRIRALQMAGRRFFRGQEEADPRGLPLIEAEWWSWLPESGGGWGSQEERVSHGTGTASILGGGAPGLSDVTGLAPGVELVLATSESERRGEGGDGLINRYEWLAEQGAQVILHEYGIWQGLYLDGSNNADAALDELSARGVLQVIPNGNLGASDKKAIYDLDGRTDVSVRWDVPDEAPGGLPMVLPFIGFHFPREMDLTVELVDPDRERYELYRAGRDDQAFEYNRTGDGHDAFAWWESVTPRGRTVFELMAFDDRQERPTPMTGRYRFLIGWRGQGSGELHVWTSDAYSGWSPGGAGFGGSATPVGTAVWPSTCDSALGVGAYGGRFDNYAGRAGEPRSYSGRGPRLDGQPITDLSGPDDPYAATADTEATPHGSFSVFGGTSGAGPHVAGVAALLLQEEGSLAEGGAEEIVARLVEMADPFPGARGHDELGGHGRVRFAPWEDPPDPDGPDPSVREVIPGEARALPEGGVERTYTVLVRHPARLPVRVLWDLGYDGEQDLTGEMVDVPFDGWDQELAVVLEVRDDLGGVGRSLVALSSGPEPPPAEGEGEGPTEGEGEGPAEGEGEGPVEGEGEGGDPPGGGGDVSGGGGGGGRARRGGCGCVLSGSPADRRIGLLLGRR